MSPVQLQNLLQQGLAHHRGGRLAEALGCYARVRSVAPRSFDAWHLSGVVALQQGRVTEALNWLEKAVALNPRSSPATMRLGLALMSAGRAKDAEPKFREALRLQPDFAEGWDNLAYCLKAQDRLREALECHQRATSLNPKSAVSWYNYGLTLSSACRVTEALECHERALAADPSYANAHYGRAQALQQSHRIPEAIEAYGVFLRQQPKHFEAQSYRLMALNYLDTLTREELHAEHVAYGRAVGEFARPEFSQEPAPSKRLRLGVLSPDLRTHSCAFFIEPLLQHLDPQEFEIFLYHDHFQEDAVSARLKAQAAAWRNLVGQPHSAVERIIRDDQIDILVDLAGHTGMTSRLPLFARHLAPVQISYLGYPNTTGVPAIGYRFTDEVADPSGEADAFATEKLVRFSNCAWAYSPPSAALDAKRPDSGPITFGCFNNASKLSDSTLRMWGQLLACVPNSRLLLKARSLGESAAQARFVERFAACGLPVDRVDFLERTASAETHLELYQRVDVALDSFPYHGTTTTCEALWMGAPVVTLAGDRHASRVGASLLRAVGHPEWVAESPERYVEIAARLASDRVALAGISSQLRREMEASVLLDHSGQSRRFADALRRCWQEWCATVAQPAEVLS